MNTQHPFKEKQQRRHRLLLGLAVGAGVLISIFLVIYVRSQRAGLLLVDAGSDITIKVNGQPVTPKNTTDGQFIQLYNGRYRLQIERPGYAPYTQDIDAKAGKVITLRPGYRLTPTTTETTASTIDYVRPSADQKSVYYLGDFRQRLYRLEVKNQVAVPLTDRALSGVTDVQWSNNPDLALVVQTDGVYLHEIPRFDYLHQIFLKVASNEYHSPVWDPANTDRLAAAYISQSGERSLVVADKRFTDVRRLTFFAPNTIESPRVQWSPAGTLLAVLSRSTDPSKQAAWLYKMESGDFFQVGKLTEIKDVRFSPDSKVLLLEKREDTGSTFIIYNLATAEQSTIQSPVPLSKIAWKDENSFFSPGSLPGTVLVRSLTGSVEEVPVSLPTTESIQTMIYLKDSRALVISTATAVFTVTL